MYSTKPDSAEIFMKTSSQVDTRLSIRTQELHLKVKNLIITTKLKKNTESPEDQTSVEPNTNPTENTQQNPLHIQIRPPLRVLLKMHRIHLSKRSKKFLKFSH